MRPTMNAPTDANRYRNASAVRRSSSGLILKTVWTRSAIGARMRELESELAGARAEITRLVDALRVATAGLPVPVLDDGEPLLVADEDVEAIAEIEEVEPMEELSDEAGDAKNGARG